MKEKRNIFQCLFVEWGTPTVAVMRSAHTLKCEVKHNEDIGMGHLGLNGQGIYGKVSFLEGICSNKHSCLSAAIAPKPEYVTKLFA